MNFISALLPLVILGVVIYGLFKVLKAIVFFIKK